MSQPDFPTLLNFFKALANESRLKIVGLLAQGEHSVEALAALLDVKEPTISHHLNKLKALNLVRMRPDGNTHFYQLNQEALQELSKAVFAPGQMTAIAETVDSNAWEDKVLRNFLEGDRLKEIPASRKKRWVILKWLVNRFEPETQYPEAIVNEVLQRSHPDCATLRRELIGYQMMQREHGVYWRLPEATWKPAD